MIRIGIIGTENSHAMAFAKLINLPDPQTGVLLHPDAQVVAVYGPDMESARKIMDEANVPTLAAGPEDFIGNVDAMMITSRRGSVHAQYAMPFIECGIPLFIDKPLTSDVGEAFDLLAKAEQKGLAITGGSGCKYADDVLALREEAKQLSSKQSLLSGSINFAADLTSIYDGFYFYASHLVEMALAIFGDDMETVHASQKNGSVLVVAGYPEYDVSLHFTCGSSTADCTLYCKERGIHRTIDISGIYAKELAHFMEMLHTKKMSHTYAALARPVQIIDAILKSLTTGKSEHI